jgi:hypothetical protein
MDSSLKSTNFTADDLSMSLHEHVGDVEDAEAEEEHHIHLPNPSLWPFILSVAILVTVIGLLFLPSNPWLSVVGAPFVLVGILGWALQDPMAAPRAEYIVTPPAPSPIAARFLIGQGVLDKNGESLGEVKARFDRYILVERGGLFAKPFYIPIAATEDEIKNNVVRLTVSEQDLLDRGLDVIPNDLYAETLDPGRPVLNGVPLFANGPLSPAETGHYNYGPNSPGINTDASGSYHREEVAPSPQRYVGERRKTYVARKAIPTGISK